MTQISPVTARDIPDLLVLIRKLINFHGETSHAGLADTQAQFVDGPMHGLIARDEGRAVGYAALVPQWRPMRPADTVDVLHLYVVEEMRGRGVGRALIAAARDWATAQGADRLTISTAASNTAAAAAYRAMGWDEITEPRGPSFRMMLADA